LSSSIDCVVVVVVENSPPTAELLADDSAAAEERWDEERFAALEAAAAEVGAFDLGGDGLRVAEAEATAGVGLGAFGAFGGSTGRSKACCSRMPPS